MSLLNQAPVAALLDRLFEEAEAGMAPVREEFSRLSVEEQAALLGSRTGYLDFYRRMKDVALPVSREDGVLLYMLARITRAKSIVEFGMSFGISTIYLAAALRDNGGGRLITSEFEPSKVARGRASIDAAGLLDLVDIREGDALETLGRNLPDAIDLLFLDGAKGLYLDILRLVGERLRPGGLIVADNADMAPAYVDHIRSQPSRYLSLRLGDAELSIHL